eukprot:933046-Prymnesium_polylepis.1
MSRFGACSAPGVAKRPRGRTVTGTNASFSRLSQQLSLQHGSGRVARVQQFEEFSLPNAGQRWK